MLDGHGDYGRRFVKVAEEIIRDWYTDNYPYFLSDASNAITECLHHTDTLIKKSIDCEVTGSTAVMMFIDSNKISVGSLGDSRAILT